MHAGTQGDPFNFYVKHEMPQIDGAVGFLTASWRSLRRYSVNNTIPIVAFNAWFQFSLAYFAAMVITRNDLSFITAIFKPELMSVYALVSVVFGAVLLASLAMKYMNKKEIKKESSIDVKIRGGKPGEISDIAENALRIEIIPNLSLTSHKKGNFSIVVPIFEEQSVILKNQKQENINKIIILTIPYIISAAIIIGALVQSGFNPPSAQDYEKCGFLEWGSIAFISIMAIVGIYIVLNKLRNNQNNNKYDFVRRFDNKDVLLPCMEDTILSVLKGQIQDPEKTDPLSRLEKLLTNFKDEIVSSFDKHLDEATYLFDKKLLEPANANIEKTLDGIGENIQETLENLKKIREDIKTDLNVLHGEISVILNDAKKFTGKVNSLDIEGTFSKVQNSIKNFYDAIKIVKDKVERLKIGKFGIPYFDGAQSNQDGHESGNNQMESDANEFLGMLKKPREEIDELKKAFEEYKKSFKDEFAELKKSLEEAKQNQLNRPDRSIGSSNDSLDAQLPEEKQVIAENKLLKSMKRTEGLKKENEKLKEKLAQQKETEEWKEKIYGELSEFFNYVLKSIKLEGESEHGEIGTTLRNFNNKIIIHWKDGSETTCYIDRQGNLQVQPNTTFNFVDKNTQAAFALACAG